MQVKKVLKTENGDELLYINLSYPVFENGILKNANDFYKRLADNFILFVSKSLLPKAEAAKCSPDFKPFSAVMTYEHEENDNKIRVMVHTFVYDGRKRTVGKTTVQCWDKKTGLISKK